MSRICVLYTGGTIGSAGEPLKPVTGPEFALLVERQPGLAGGRVAGFPDLVYKIEWLGAPKDSSDIGPSDWADLALALLDRYGGYDGFVILHGTDTMAATASALSFMLPGLSKPVVLTGSQLPLARAFSDGAANLTGAIVMAAVAKVPECCVFFDSLLLRGNRAVKADAGRLAAFSSPGLPPLGEAGTSMRIDSRLVRPPPPPGQSLDDEANRAGLRKELGRLRERLGEFSVPVLALHPGIRASTASAVLEGVRPPVGGAVIEAFGTGNGPSDKDFLAALKRAADKGAVLAVTTRTRWGRVDLGAYGTGRGLADAGCIGAADMTTDAALAKLVWLLGSGLSAPRVRERMPRDLAGELTPEGI